MERHRRSAFNVEEELGETWQLAKEIYNSEMEERMQLQGNEPMSKDELEELHKKVVAVTMQECQKNHSLGFDQKRKLRSALEFQLEKFVEQNNMKAVKTPAIGIDLGTTYCCVGVYQDGKVKMVTNEIGRTTTPSYCAFDGEHYFTGQPAKDQAHINPENTIFDAKRLIGRKFNDRVVQKDIKLWPFEVVREKDIPKIRIDDETYYPEEISANILTKLKQEAQDFLGGVEVTKAVITVPAYFNNAQRQATKDAGAIAGLEVLRILNEPSAAAITYSLHRIDKRKRNVLIFDLGGGTFDVSVLSIEDGNIQIKAVGGDTHLGGEDFDNEMVEYCINEFKKSHDIDLAQGKDSEDFETKFKACKRLRRIRNECERQKCSLSFAQRATVAMDSIYGPHDLKIIFTRKKFEELIEDKLSLCIEKVDEVLEDGGLTKDQIEDVVLVGGSSRIPKIQQLLSEYFDGKTLFKSIHPDEAIAHGAATVAAILNGCDDNNTKESVVLSEVLSFSLGVQIRDGDFSVIIPKNTAIPFETKRRYVTRYDDQIVMKFPIYEGEEKLAKNNHLLGELELKNIPPSAAGEEACDVIMKIDAEGILTVKAVNVKNSDITRDIQISLDTGRLTQDDIYNLQFRGRDKVFHV